MSILRDFEQRLEGAVEGFFARAFRSGLQPVELAKALQRYPANYQQVGIDGVIVPNVYRFVLSSDDLDRLGGYVETLQRELADVVVRTADESGWKLKGPVRIELEEGDHVRVGTYELRGKVEARKEPSRPAQQAAPAPPPVRVVDEQEVEHAGAGGDTKLMPAQGAPGRAVLHVLGGGSPPKRLAKETVIGRLPECDLTLSDSSVSRQHARITEEGGTWTITDLGSTNGMRVNGEKVGSAELAHGDRVELGSVRLAFSLEQ